MTASPNVRAARSLHVLAVVVGHVFELIDARREQVNGSVTIRIE
jgi:hypothetical protein